MRGQAVLARLALGLWLAVWVDAGLARPVMAQDMGGQAPGGAVLTLDQDRLFVESAFGRASLARQDAAVEQLEAENSRIEAELIAEEQALTDRRATLPTEEFAALAAAFDEKVERIRTEQDNKARQLARTREEDRQAFLRAVVPVLASLLEERGAAAILDKSTVILSLTALDITDEAIARVDAAMAAATLPEGTGEAGPETEPPPP